MSAIRAAYHRGYFGVLAIISLMLITLYLAFAFPYSLFHLKQSETTELKSVIIVGRHGEEVPNSEAYFIGEEPPEELRSIGAGQLTNVSTTVIANILNL